MRALRAQLASDGRHLHTSLRNNLKGRRDALTGLAAQLELLNPQRTLERGYAILTDDKGAILRSPAQLQPRQNIGVRLAEGSAQIGIASVQPSLD